MNGLVDESRRTLLARIAGIVSLVPGVDVAVEGSSSTEEKSNDDSTGTDEGGWSTGGEGNYDEKDDSGDRTTSNGDGDESAETGDDEDDEDDDDEGGEDGDAGESDDASDAEETTDGSDYETAIVDRVEDGTAVVLFEDAGYQRTVSTDVLPDAAREEGVVLRVPEDEELALAEVDHSATQDRRNDLQDRFDELAQPLSEEEQ